MGNKTVTTVMAIPEEEGSGLRIIFDRKHMVDFQVHEGETLDDLSSSFQDFAVDLQDLMDE